MKATLILRDKTFEIKSGMTIRGALEKIRVEPESVLATRQGELLTDDEIIKEGDVIKLVSVISGGIDG
jgi:sulfur carrier protein ThiS